MLARQQQSTHAARRGGAATSPRAAPVVVGRPQQQQQWRARLPAPPAAASSATDVSGPTTSGRTTTTTSTSSTTSSSSAAALKKALLAAVEFTSRGANTTAEVRGAVEEAVLALEAEQAPAGLDYALLEGAWRLVYTTAPDVIPIVGFDGARLVPTALAGIAPPPVVVGDVLQRFSRVGDDGAGVVENVIRFGLPPLTAPRDGVTFTVKARCARLNIPPSLPPLNASLLALAHTRAHTTNQPPVPSPQPPSHLSP